MKTAVAPASGLLTEAVISSVLRDEWVMTHIPSGISSWPSIDAEGGAAIVMVEIEVEAAAAHCSEESASMITVRRRTTWLDLSHSETLGVTIAFDASFGDIREDDDSTT